jgi:hypothetical protein
MQYLKDEAYLFPASFLIPGCNLYITFIVCLYNWNYKISQIMLQFVMCFMLYQFWYRCSTVHMNRDCWLVFIIWKYFTLHMNFLIFMSDLGLPWWWLWRMLSSGMLRHVALIWTDVSEEHFASIIRVTRISEEILHSMLQFLVTANIPSFLSPWWWRRYIPLKRRFLQEPHSSTSQKMAFFLFFTFLDVMEHKYLWNANIFPQFCTL